MATRKLKSTVGQSLTVTGAGITPWFSSAWQVIAVGMYLQVCNFPELIVTYYNRYERTALNLIELLKKSSISLVFTLTLDFVFVNDFV